MLHKWPAVSHILYELAFCSGKHFAVVFKIRSQSDKNNRFFFKTRNHIWPKVFQNIYILDDVGVVTTYRDTLFPLHNAATLWLLRCVPHVLPRHLPLPPSSLPSCAPTDYMFSLCIPNHPKTFTLALIYYSKCFAAVSVAACLSLCVSLMMKLLTCPGCDPWTYYTTRPLIQESNYSNAETWRPCIPTCLPWSGLQFGLVCKLVLGSELVSD